MAFTPSQGELLQFLNRATRKELCKLPGIGGGKADRIQQGRPLRSWQDLVRLGFTDDQLQRLQATVNALGVEVRAAHSEGEPDQSEARLEDESEHSDDDLTPETPLNRYIERWQKQKRFFAEKFNQLTYYDGEADKAAALEYYGALNGDFSFPSLSRLLSQRRRFGGRRAFLFPWMDRHPDGSLQCVYSGRLLSDNLGNLVERCNEEHSFPQSWQAQKAHTGRDNHHIFAAATSVNSLRGNIPFGDAGEVVESGDWGEKRVLPNGKKLFTPARNHGALARGSLYIFVAYPGALDSSKLLPESLEWLIRKASEEPVTDWERHRNATAHSHQGVRNAFIDHPELVATIDWWDVLGVTRERAAKRRH